MDPIWTNLIAKKRGHPLKTQQQHGVVFEARFSRCRELLFFLAGRVLGDSEQAEEAVENCWRTASRNPPQFEYESAFRSWVVRLLVDEALAILASPQDTRRSTASFEQVSPEEFRDCSPELSNLIQVLVM
jgi:DNA-directed RNA polymerase specialized sigma24 family protein